MLTYTPKQVVELLASKRGDRNQRAFAEEVGVSQQYLCNVLNGQRLPGPAILNYLDLEPTFIPKRNRGVKAA